MVNVGKVSTGIFIHSTVNSRTHFNKAVMAVNPECVCFHTDSSSCPLRLTVIIVSLPGVSPPQLILLNQRTVEVYWLTPAVPNGEITRYRLFRATADNPYTVLHENEGTSTNYTDETLQPESQYSFLLEASTQAGGTNSTPTSLQTPAITPAGIPAPSSLTAINSTAVFVAWFPPSEPNGVIDQYQILLNAGSADVIEKGVGVTTSAMVGGLQPYTEYRVRIRACIQRIPNSCGVGPSRTVRTLSDIPTGQGPPQLQATGPTTVVITWEPPASPNGVIQQYRIQRRLKNSFAEVLIATRDGETLSFTNNAPELQPYTEYEYRITAVNSVGETSSPWVTVRTLEATPLDLATPLISEVSPYSIQLSWQPPVRPNGVIVTYQVEYRVSGGDPTSPSTESVTVDGSVTSTSVSGLRPYTEYEIRLVARNLVGEVSSDWVSATTAQAAPADISAFAVERVASGTSVILRWEPPGEPNGVINNYLIYEDGSVNPIYQGLSREFEYRRLLPYTEYRIQLEACTQGGCARAQVQTFLTAEIAPDNQPPPSVGTVNATAVTLHWTGPVNPYGRILSYQVLRRSGGARQRRDVSEVSGARQRRDVSEVSGVRQRRDVSEVSGARQRRDVSEAVVIHTITDTDREEYSYTDWDVLPYTTYEYKIRASNSIGHVDSPWQMVETPEAAPSGVAPPTVSQIPNQYDKLLIRWVEPSQPNGQILNYKLRRNESVPWSFVIEDPKEYIDSNLAPYTWYAYTIEACTGGGCTTSEATVMRTSQSAPLSVPPPTLTPVNSTAIQAAWNQPQVTNGEITEYQLKVNDVIVYRGIDRIYTAANLQPFEAYTFMVTACTPGGCTDSEGVVGRPSEAVPSGMSPPTLRVTSATSVEITWTPPSQPNGIITSYEVRRGEVLIDTNTEGRLQFVDYEVEPDTTYSYTVTVFNSQGSVTSLPATITTYPSSPEGLATPILEALSATSIRATWSPPLRPNGPILNYTLLQGELMNYAGTALSFTVVLLEPWTEYSFRVKACTAVGCTTSEPASVRTLGAPPEGMAAPTLTPQADSTGAHSGVSIQWSPPARPNGVITEYEVHRRNYSSQTPGKGWREYIVLGTGSALYWVMVVYYTGYWVYCTGSVLYCVLGVHCTG